MSEPIKNRKLTLRELMDEIAEDEAFSDEERELAQEKVLEMEDKERSSRVKKLTS